MRLIQFLCLLYRSLKLLENAYKNRQLLAKKNLADGLLTEQQFQDLSYDLEMQHLADTFPQITCSRNPCVASFRCLWLWKTSSTT